MKKTEIPIWKFNFINKHLDCIGENCIADFDIYNDSAFSKDLDQLLQAERDKIVNQIKSLYYGKFMPQDAENIIKHIQRNK